MADVEVELLAVGLDLSRAVARLGYAPGQGHSHALSHTHTCTYITPGWGSLNPHTTSQSPKPSRDLLKSPPPRPGPPTSGLTSDMPISASARRALRGEIWIGYLLHVSLGDNQGVNYVGVSGQSYLWEACQVLRCRSETCGLKRLLHCKSGHAGHVCLDIACLRVCACVWGLVFAGRRWGGCFVIMSRPGCVDA